MLVTVVNLSQTALTAHSPAAASRLSKGQDSGTNALSVLRLHHNKSGSIDLESTFRTELVIRAAFTQAGEDDQKTATIDRPGDLKIHLSRHFGASWRSVAVPEDAPWRVYTNKVSHEHRQVVILSRRNLASFLSTLPDRLPLYSLQLPGTHDTMAFYGWPFSQCQSISTPLTTQLNDGIRVIDIRLAVIPPPPPGSTVLDENANHQLIAYHGIMPQRATFTSILKEMQDFLTSPVGKREAIVMTLKQEDFVVTPAPIFSALVKKTIMEGPGGWDAGSPSGGVNRGMWFLENRIPTLGEVRGKVVMLSRFGGDGTGWDQGLEGIGIHPTTWPDSQKEGFEWELKGVRVRTHDWYNISTLCAVPEKVQRACANLIAPPSDSPPTLAITYFSSASIPFALPPVVAKGALWFVGVNDRLGSWLLSQLSGNSPGEIATAENEKSQEAGNAVAILRLRGWTFLDFYSESDDNNLVPLLVECNYQGRRSGEEGW